MSPVVLVPLHGPVTHFQNDHGEVRATGCKRRENFVHSSLDHPFSLVSAHHICCNKTIGFCRILDITELFHDDCELKHSQ